MTKYEHHIRNKQRAKEEKNIDKQKSKVDPNFRSITFDLQKVPQCPCSGIGPLYYARKLSVYNLTVYENDTRRGICYVWDESQGQRGANEIGT